MTSTTDALQGNSTGSTITAPIVVATSLLDVVWTPVIVVAIPYLLYGLYSVQLATSLLGSKKRKTVTRAAHRAPLGVMYLLVTIGLACIGFLSYLNINTYVADVQMRNEGEAGFEGMEADEYIRRISLERVIQSVMVLANCLNNGILFWRLRTIWDTQTRSKEALLLIPIFLSVANTIFGILTLSPFSPLFVPSTPTPAQASVNFYNYIPSLNIDLSRSIPAMSVSMRSSLMRIYDVSSVLASAVGGFMIAGRLFYVSCRKTRTIFLDSGLLYPTTLSAYIFLQLLQSLAQARAWDERSTGVIGERERLRRKLLICAEVVYHSLLPVLGITTTMVITRLRATTRSVPPSPSTTVDPENAPAKQLSPEPGPGPSPLSQELRLEEEEEEMQAATLSVPSPRHAANEV
ncbi:hypothetical protein PQX77_012271 [Marasmius sp. AFHP31]|nr:hypothetical protein PQX77_012271 [Marasmius sp. AFHP31]